MAPKDLLNAGLPQAFNLLKKKKKMQYLNHSEAKHNALMYDCVNAHKPMGS